MSEQRESWFWDPNRSAEEHMADVEKLVKLCRGFIGKHRVTCPEATANDAVYEHAPDLVHGIAEIVGYHKIPEDDE